MSSTLKKSLFIIVPLALVVVVVLATQSWIFADMQQKETNGCSVVQRMNAPFHPLEVVSEGVDVTSSYNLAYATAAKNALALAIDKAVQPHQQGLVVYFTLINHTSFAPESTVMV